MKAAGTAYVQAIAEFADFPMRGFVALATVGLSDHGGFELASAAPSRFKSVIKATFDVASYVASGHRKLEPGVVFEKALAHFYTKSDVGHWLVRNEAPAGLEIAELSLPGRRVRWLHAWPITSDELVLLQANRNQDLESLLDRAGMAAFDIGRGSLEGVPAFDPWARKT
jgi:hypothetical protein